MADLAQVEQVWPEWRERFGLPFGKWATWLQSGSGRSGCPSERRSPQRIPSGGSRSHSALSGRHHGPGAGSDCRYPLNPPVTASVRIVSVIGDTMQHLGQAAYVRGLAERRDSAWHQPGAADR